MREAVLVVMLVSAGLFACLGPVIELGNVPASMANGSGNGTGNDAAGGGSAGGVAGGSGGGGDGGLLGGDAGSVPLTWDGGTPNVLAAGVMLAFDSNRAGGNRDIYLLTGGTIERLTTHLANDREPAISHDGTRIAFVSDRAGYRDQVFVMDLQTRVITQVTSMGGDQPAWSLDDQCLAFHRDPGVYVINLDGTAETPVILGPDAWNSFAHPAFLPGDPGHLLVDRYNQISLVTVKGVWVRDVVQNSSTRIQAPALSPSGFQVAHEVWCLGDPGTRLQIVPIGTMTRPCEGVTVAPAISHHPAWGSDYLAYSQDGELWLLPVLGIGTPVNATQHPADDENPAFRPPP